MTDSYATEVAADTPWVWYRYEEADGTTVLPDSSGNGRDGTYNGSKLHRSGIACGSALECDNVSYSQLNDSAELDTFFGGSYSWECWFYADAAVSVRRFSGKAPPNPGVTNGDSAALLMVSGEVWFSSGAHNDADILQSPTAGWDDQQWHHVVAQRDASVSPVRLHLWLDGSLVASRDEVNAYVANAGDWYVGIERGGDAGANQNWDGGCDEAALYDYLLSGTRIGVHYSTRASCFDGGTPLRLFPRHDGLTSSHRIFPPATTRQSREARVFPSYD